MQLSLRMSRSANCSARASSGVNSAIVLRRKDKSATTKSAGNSRWASSGLTGFCNASANGLSVRLFDPLIVLAAIDDHEFKVKQQSFLHGLAVAGVFAEYCVNLGNASYFFHVTVHDA